MALSAISPVMPDKICTEENNNNNSDFNGYFSMVDKDNKKIQKKVNDSMGFKIKLIEKIKTFLSKFISRQGIF